MRVQERERAFLKGVVDSGAASKDPLVANSCQWLIDGKVRLYAVTMVGRDYEGPRDLGDQGPVRVVIPNYMVAGTGPVYGAPPVPYRVSTREEIEEAIFAGPGELAPIAADPNVTTWPGDFESNPAFAVAGLIAFAQPSRRGKELTLQTIKHEVQHSADKHDGSALGKYKSEYRAYTYEEEPGIRSKVLAPPTKRAVEGHEMELNDHQLRIVLNLYRDAKAYPYMRENWEDPSFRAAIEAYRDPDTEGFNRFNSVRVDNLYLALDAVTPGATTVSPAVVSVINALRPSERKYVASGSAVWKEKLDHHFVGPARRQVLEQMTGPARPAPGRPVAPAPA